MKITLCAFADEAASPLEEQIKALQENRISFIELRRVNGKSLQALTRDDARDIRNRLEESGISVWAAGSAVGKKRQSVRMERYAEEVSAVCATANLLGTRNLRAFSLYPGIFNHDRALVLNKLAEILKITNAHGLTYCLENEKGVYGSTIPRVGELLRHFPELRFVYDPANFIQCGQDPAKCIERFAGSAYYFHCKDATGKKVVPAGFGEGQLGRLVRSLTQDTVLTVEPHLQLFRGSPAFDKDELFWQYDLRTPRGRFDCAIAACRKLLTENGYRDYGSYFLKEPPQATAHNRQEEVFFHG